jgi:hypothetical protein
MTTKTKVSEYPTEVMQAAEVFATLHPETVAEIFDPINGREAGNLGSQFHGLADWIGGHGTVADMLEALRALVAIANRMKPPPGTDPIDVPDEEERQAMAELMRIAKDDTKACGTTCSAAWRRTSCGATMTTRRPRLILCAGCLSRTLFPGAGARTGPAFFHSDRITPPRYLRTTADRAADGAFRSDGRETRRSLRVHPRERSTRTRASP